MTERRTITMAHGSGGRDSATLMREIFGKHFSNATLDKLEDGAVLPCCGEQSIVVSTDSFVVTPLEFPGGDIGKLAVCGTVNDVLMMGAVPKYLTCGFILEEGLQTETLDRIVASMARAAKDAGVTIIAGDTKVIEKRAASGAMATKAAGGGARAAETDGGSSAGESGLFINTTGIGFLRDGISLAENDEPTERSSDYGTTEFNSDSHATASAPSADKARVGDAVIVSGNLGDHHACILSARLGLVNGIESDCAALTDVVNALYESGADIHTMRDVTRGGLGTVLNEIAVSSGVQIELDEDSIPVTDEVRAFCGVMGLDPIYMGNEGEMIAIISAKDEDKALKAMQNSANGANATIIGHIATQTETQSGVIMKTRIGGTRRIPVLQGEGLPRIC